MTDKRTKKYKAEKRVLELLAQVKQLEERNERQGNSIETREETIRDLHRKNVLLQDKIRAQDNALAQTEDLQKANASSLQKLAETRVWLENTQAELERVKDFLVNATKAKDSAIQDFMEKQEELAHVSKMLHREARITDSLIGFDYTKPVSINTVETKQA